MKRLLVSLLFISLMLVVNLYSEENVLEMVLVEGGTFKMGSDSEEAWEDEKPVHWITLDSFYVGKYPVTQRQFLAVMGTNPSFFRGSNLPVDQVSWYDAIKYSNKLSIKEGLTPVYSINGDVEPNYWRRGGIIVDWAASGYRLLTEAEWEFAARGGVRAQNAGTFDDRWAGTDVEAALGDYAWYDANSTRKTNPVGKKLPNELGLYDMSGNIWEWCWDWYGSYTGSTKINPRGPKSGDKRVLRGGAWVILITAVFMVAFQRLPLVLTVVMSAFGLLASLIDYLL